MLAVLILGFFYNNGTGVAEISSTAYSDTVEIGKAFIGAIPQYLKETAIALIPIIVILAVFQLCLLRMSKVNLERIVFGMLYTYVGLVLFLTGVNVGFSSLGYVMGSELAHGTTKYLLVPLAMVMGWFVISAEPAVAVLEKQIESVSAGAIPGKAIKISLSVAVSSAMGISMLRVLTGISILWFVVPGYITALALTFFVPHIYTAIAFDSGGVASGPLTATFMLQFVIGASRAVGGNVLSDAFGAVAMVAMMPLLSIQIIGLIYERRKSETPEETANYGDCDIVELWEVE